MKLWQDLTKTAILGTQREACAPSSAEGPLGDLLGPLAGAQSEPEAALLAAAAIAETYQRAGYKPGRGTRTIEPCKAETLPLCKGPAANFLARMISGEHQAVMAEFLQALSAAGKLVPPEYLGDLLELAGRERDLREMLPAVVGHRGLWLAAQNEAWQYLAVGECDEDWETALPAARPALLRGLRAKDPAAALAGLAKTWENETPDDRAEFVAALEVGLSIADERFLEQALDDRRKEVRRLAAELLTRIGDSALCRRMLERVEKLLTFVAGGKSSFLGLKRGQKASIAVALPAECDKAMIRDGLEVKPPKDGRKLGEKAWWLLQMLSAVGPSTWSDRWKVSPEALLEIAGDNEDWKAVLVEGFARAAGRHADAAWAEALLSKPLEMADFGIEVARDLLAAVSVEDRERAAHAMLKSSSVLNDGSAAGQLLLACTHKWTPRLTATVLASIRNRLRGGNAWQCRELLMILGLRMDVAAAAASVDDWREQVKDLMPAEIKMVDEFVSLIQFRRDCLAAVRT